MSELTPQHTREIYSRFTAPIAEFDCGIKCAPYNGGVPVCCDTKHAVPTAYQGEWAYLQENTNLWHKWQADNEADFIELTEDAGPDLVLIECLGHTQCQRGFRSIVCRAFPFFPYFNSSRELLGLSYYWDYEYRCWVISNLQVVTDIFRTQCIGAYEQVFRHQPKEIESYYHHSAEMRQVFRDFEEDIHLLHREGGIYKIDPATEELTRTTPEKLPKFGPFEIADTLKFPDEEF